MPAHRTANKNSIFACCYLRHRERERGRGRECWGEGCWWGSSFGPSFSPLALLAGASVQVLLITSHWSGNPADLTGSNCCPGLSALSTPLPLPPAFPPSAPSPHKVLKCLTAKGAPRRRAAGRIGGTGVRALGACPHKPSSLEMSKSGLPPRYSPAIWSEQTSWGFLAEKGALSGNKSHQPHQEAPNTSYLLSNLAVLCFV